METLLISDIKVGTRLQGGLFLDEGFLLLDANCPFTEELQKALVEWNYKNVFSKQAYKPLEIAAAEKNDGENEKAPVKKMSADEFESVDLDDLLGTAPSEKKADAQNSPVDSTTSETAPTLNVDGGNYQNDSEAEEEKIQQAQNAYKVFLSFTLKVYTRFATNKELNMAELSEYAKKLSVFVQNNASHILRITPEVAVSGRDFLISHCLRTAVFSIAIAQQMNLPSQQITELAVAAFLHEIGQIRLPPQLYLIPRALTPNERALLMTHTVLGYNIMKDYKFPISVQRAVFEHHERENGTGYPRRLDGSQISLYAKILGVACSFEALTAPREYKSQKKSYEAMLEMVQNAQKKYDETIIKAMLLAIPLYPVGAYVLLSNGKIARVSDINRNDPRNPLVQIIDEHNELGNPLKIQVDGVQLQIATVLDKNDLQRLNLH